MSADCSQSDREAIQICYAIDKAKLEMTLVVYEYWNLICFIFLFYHLKNENNPTVPLLSFPQKSPLVKNLKMNGKTFLFQVLPC